MAQRAIKIGKRIATFIANSEKKAVGVCHTLGLSFAKEAKNVGDTYRSSTFGIVLYFYDNRVRVGVLRRRQTLIRVE